MESEKELMDKNIEFNKSKSDLKKSFDIYIKDISNILYSLNQKKINNYNFCFDDSDYAHIFNT